MSSFYYINNLLKVNGKDKNVRPMKRLGNGEKTIFFLKKWCPILDYAKQGAQREEKKVL